MWRSLAGLFTVLVFVAPGLAQSYSLSEVTRANDCYNIQLRMRLAGEMKVKREGKDTNIRLEAMAEHHYTEKLLHVGDKPWPLKSARHYSLARSALNVGSDRMDRSLGENRRLIIAQRGGEPTWYSPAGPLTRSELELVSEHFDTLHVLGLLPNKEVAFAPAGKDPMTGQELPAKADTWKIEGAVVQALCQFEGLVSHDLVGQINHITDGHAHFTITGKAQGIELGALATLQIEAVGKFDLLNKHLVELTWKQRDERDQGPASPAVKAESTVEMRRALLAEEPKELSATALVAVPDGLSVPAGAMTQLFYRDPKGRFQMVHAREWHIVAQTHDHTVMRLLERGDLVAQATITPWRKAEAGKHMSPTEFKAAMDATPGLDVEEPLEEGVVPSDEGRWVYRYGVRGTLDGVAVVQNFYIVAGPNGDQVVIAVTMRPAQVSNIGTRDLSLVNAIEFLKTP